MTVLHSTSDFPPLDRMFLLISLFEKDGLGKETEMLLPFTEFKVLFVQKVR